MAVAFDTLPVDERSGLTGTKTTFQNLLVFRREVVAEVVAQPGVRLTLGEPQSAATPRLGPAEGPSGPAPAVGPAKAELAAE